MLRARPNASFTPPSPPVASRGRHRGGRFSRGRRGRRRGRCLHVRVRALLRRSPSIEESRAPLAGRRVARGDRDPLREAISSTGPSSARLRPRGGSALGGSLHNSFEGRFVPSMVDGDTGNGQYEGEDLRQGVLSLRLLLIASAGAHRRRRNVSDIVTLRYVKRGRSRVARPAVGSLNRVSTCQHPKRFDVPLARRSKQSQAKVSSE